MEDEEILALYFARNEKAISATAEKYHNYCMSVAANILSSREDCAECVNDTWLHAWNAIPPHKPENLSGFLAKITRNLAFSFWRRENAKKRGSGEIMAVLDELEECLSGHDTVECELDRKEFAETLDAFLATLGQEERVIFLRRYWYAASVKEIAAAGQKSEAAVSKMLSRTRVKLKNYLTERGFDL